MAHQVSAALSRKLDFETKMVEFGQELAKIQHISKLLIEDVYHVLRRYLMNKSFLFVALIAAYERNLW